ncbi:MAG: fibrobacter succinogenes major paralogous domain-containing protein [Bacteroidetes bacterium]|nr:fibrobacter succinogenes major paralogous domain-containing protein [Bacteroidota bacterium]
MKLIAIILMPLILFFNGFKKNDNSNELGNGTKTIIESNFSNDSNDNGTLVFNGFTYHTVIIGSQEWTVENLRTTIYNDGTLITKITDENEWKRTTSGAYCAFDNDERNVRTYGYLYNWFTVSTGKLAPTGWRVPTVEDWKALTEYIGGKNFGGTRLKSTAGWERKGNGTDEYGFKALPGGDRDGNSSRYYQLGLFGEWWTSTNVRSDKPISISMSHSYPTINFNNQNDMKTGYSLRLVRDL